MEITDELIISWMTRHLWPLFRIASFFMIIPIIGTQLVPARIRLGLALMTTILVAPLIEEIPVIDPLSLSAISILLQQVFIGSMLGFMFILFVQLFAVAGQIIAMQMGLGFASMVDPTNGVTVPVLSQIFLICVTLLFLATNGHLVMIEVFIESFRAWPISETFFTVGGFSPEVIWLMIHRISWMFASALLVALPVITSVLVINISFGIMSRASPQMNVFALGFPISQLFGMLIIWVGFVGFLPQYHRFTGDVFVFLRTLLGA
mgnify:CR=1 FL=1